MVLEKVYGGRNGVDPDVVVDSELGGDEEVER